MFLEKISDEGKVSGQCGRINLLVDANGEVLRAPKVFYYE